MRGWGAVHLDFPQQFHSQPDGDRSGKVLDDRSSGRPPQSVQQLDDQCCRRDDLDLRTGTDPTHLSIDHRGDQRSVHGPGQLAINARTEGQIECLFRSHIHPPSRSLHFLLHADRQNHPGSRESLFWKSRRKSGFLGQPHIPQASDQDRQDLDRSCRLFLRILDAQSSLLFDHHPARDPSQQRPTIRHGFLRVLQRLPLAVCLRCHPRRRQVIHPGKDQMQKTVE